MEDLQLTANFFNFYKHSASYKKKFPADLNLIKKVKISQHLVANTNAKSVIQKLAKNSNTT